MIILDKGSVIPPRVFSSFKQNFPPEEKYFYQKYSGQIWHCSEWSVKGWMRPRLEVLHLTLFALIHLSSPNYVTAGCAVPQSMLLIFSAVSCFLIGCQTSWSFQHMAKVANGLPGTRQISLLAPVKGFPIRPIEDTHELIDLKLQEISLSIASLFPFSYYHRSVLDSPRSFPSWPILLFSCYKCTDCSITLQCCMVCVHSMKQSLFKWSCNGPEKWYLNFLKLSIEAETIVCQLDF